jgi:hypothetical protein
MKTHRLKILLLEENWQNKDSLSFILTSSSGQFFEMSLSEVSQSSYDLNTSETISIRISNSITKELVSHIEFPLVMLRKQTEWIPLIPSGKPAVSKTFSEPVNVPRLLIELLPIKGLNEHDSQDFLESFASELALVSMMENSSLDSQDLMQNSDCYGKYKRQCTITKILAKQLEHLRDRILSCNEKVKNLESCLENANFERDQALNQGILAEKELIDLVQEKEVQLRQLINQNSSLENRLRVTENEKEHLLNKITRYELELEKNRFLEKELSNSRTLLRRSEEVQDHLNKKLISLSKSLKETTEDTMLLRQINAKDQEIAMLKLLTEEIKRSGDMHVLSMKMENEELKLLLATQDSSPSKPSACYGSRFESLLNDFLKKFPICKKLSLFSIQVLDQVLDLAYTKEGIYLKSGKTLKNLDSFFEETQKKSPVRETLEKSLEKESKLKKQLSHSFLKETKSSLNKNRSTLSKSPMHGDSLKKRPFLL